MAFGVAALTMALLMFTLAILVGAAQDRVIATLREGTGQMKRWSAFILVIVGAWLIVLAIWADILANLLSV